MEFINNYRIIWYCIYGVLATGVIICAPIVALSSVMVAACVDMVIKFSNHDFCSLEMFASFTISLGVLLFISIFLLRRATKLDHALVVTISGIIVCLFLEYAAGLSGYGNLTSIFTLALGYIISGRERWKITWKPRKQFFVLFLVVVLSITLYTVGPNHTTDSLLLFDHEYLKTHIPLMMRLVGEVCILVAIMHFGKGAMEWILTATR